MKTQLQRVQTADKAAFIAESPKLTQMARIIAIKVNALYAYPLNKEQVEDWVTIINELLPNMTPEKLNDIVNKAILGVVNWDVKKGVQNLIQAAIDPNSEMILELKSQECKRRLPKMVV